MSELTRRILIAVPAALLFILVVHLGGTLLTATAILAALIISFEMFRLFKSMGFPVYAFLSLLIIIFIWFMPLLPGWIAVTVVAALAAGTLFTSLSGQKIVAGRWLATIYCGTYASLGWFLFVRIRNMEPDIAGFWLAITLLLAIWSNDTFAYLGGRSFGKRLLAPSISPNKTWEGFFCGLAGAVGAIAVVTAVVESFPLRFITMLPVALIVSLFGPAGDLLASKLKRTAGVKDSSGLLPGHGGFLDRFDAFLLSVPFVFFYLNWIL